MRGSTTAHSLRSRRQRGSGTGRDPRTAKPRVPSRALFSSRQLGLVGRDFRPWLIREAASGRDSVPA